MPSGSFPFIGPTYQTQSLKVGVERLVNLYTEITESPIETERATYYGTPGTIILATLPDSPGRGIFAQDGRCWAVAGWTLYELTYASENVLQWTVRGRVANDARLVSFASHGMNGHLLFL